MIGRVISSIVLVALVALVIFALPAWCFLLALTVFIVIGLAEYFLMIGRKGIPAFPVVGFLAGIALPVVIYFRPDPSAFREPAVLAGSLLLLLVLVCLRGETAQATAGISFTMFGILYVSWMMCYLIKLRQLPSGTQLVAFCLLLAKAGDIGAFLTGSLLGRHPLARRISPHKTIEGTVGGFVFNVGAALGTGKFLAAGVGNFHLVVLGLLLGLTGMVGDLAESMFKRDTGVKDSGFLIPGIGGVLDLIDSIIFTAPVFYFYAVIFLRK